MSEVFLLGVAGGSGSGKTYFAKALNNKLKQLSENHACSEIVYQDNFYIDQSHRFDKDGGAVNFDHPSAIDFDLLAKCLKELKSGQATQIPTYDFATHKRKAETIRIEPQRTIIVDGILIFHAPQVRELFDDLIFFQTDEDLRFNRRLERDVIERGRTPEGVREQFYKQVKPMHDLYVEPSRVYAKSIINDIGHFDNLLNIYCNKIIKK